MDKRRALRQTGNGGRTWLPTLFVFFLHGTLFLALTGVLAGGVPAYRFLLPLLVLTFLAQRGWVSAAAGVLTNRALLPLWAWLGLAVLSLLWVQDYFLAVRGIYFLALGAGLVAIFHVHPERTKQLVVTAAVAAAIIVLAGVVEYFTGWHLPQSLYYGRSVANPTSVFHNPNDFGFFLSLYAWLFFALAHIATGKLARFASWLLFALAIALVPLTGSRGAMLALMVQAIVLVLVFAVKIFLDIKAGNKGKQIITQAVTIFMVALLVAVSGLAGPSLLGSGQSVLELFSLFAGDGTAAFREAVRDFFGAARWNLAANGLAMLRDSNYLGVGAGNVEAYMGQYSQTHYPVGRLVNPHNWWIELLANYGLPGLLLYLAFIALAVRRLLAVILKRDKNSTLAAAGIVALAGFVFSSMSPSSIMALRPHWVMYGLLGFIAFYPGFVGNPQQDNAGRTCTPVNRQPGP